MTEVPVLNIPFSYKCSKLDGALRYLYTLQFSQLAVPQFASNCIECVMTTHP